MGADDNGVIDPRSPLDRANRDQMREFAEKNGITEITWDMSGDEMRYLLIRRGIRDIGQTTQFPKVTGGLKAADDGTPTIRLEDLQHQQWEQRAKEREEANKPRKRGRPRKVNGQPHAS